MILRPPSHTTAVAYLALFTALGGSAYAAGVINGKSLKDRSVPGKKLKKNAVTGAEVNEAKLGRVPLATSARAADSATRAGNAATLGGLGADAFLRTGGTASDASKLGGLAPDAFLHADARASDSAKLGGLAPSAFERSGTTVRFGRIVMNPDDPPITTATSGPLSLSVSCPDIAGPNAVVSVASTVDSNHANQVYAEGTTPKATTGSFDAGSTNLIQAQFGSTFWETTLGSVDEPGGHALLWQVYADPSATDCTFYGTVTPLP